MSQLVHCIVVSIHTSVVCTLHAQILAEQVFRNISSFLLFAKSKQRFVIWYVNVCILSVTFVTHISASYVTERGLILHKLSVIKVTEECVNVHILLTHIDTMTHHVRGSRGESFN